MIPCTTDSNVFNVLSGHYNPILMTIMGHLNQIDIENYISAFPSVRNQLLDVQVKHFPIIDHLQFTPATQQPIPIRKFYGKIYLTQNLDISHPASRAIMNNAEFLSEITFAYVNISDVKCTIFEALIKSDIVLDRLVLENLTCTTSTLENTSDKIISDGKCHIRELEIKNLRKYVYGTGPLIPGKEVAVFVRSVKLVEALYLPRAFFRGPTSVRFLMARTSNIVQLYSMKNAVFSPAIYAKVFAMANRYKYCLVDVQYDSILSLSPVQCQRFFGKTIQRLTSIRLQPESLLDERVQKAFQIASQVHIQIGVKNLVADIEMDIQKRPHNKRVLSITCHNDKFPVDGLLLGSPINQILKSTFQAFGNFDFLNISNCQLPRQVKLFDLQQSFGNYFNHIV